LSNIDEETNKYKDECLKLKIRYDYLSNDYDNLNFDYDNLKKSFFNVELENIKLKNGE
jgi:hypothetical protein